MRSAWPSVVAGLVAIAIVSLVGYAIKAQYEWERIHPCVRWATVPHHTDGYAWTEMRTVSERRSRDGRVVDRIRMPVTHYEPARDWTTVECVERTTIVEAPSR